MTYKWGSRLMCSLSQLCLHANAGGSRKGSGRRDKEMETPSSENPQTRHNPQTQTRPQNPQIRHTPADPDPPAVAARGGARGRTVARRGAGCRNCNGEGK